MLNDPHIGFVIAAYAIAFAVLAAMIGSVVIDYWRLSADLDEANRTLEAARQGRESRSRSRS